MVTKSTTSKAPSLPLHVVTLSAYAAWLKKQDTSLKNWLKDTGFVADIGAFSILPADDGHLAGAVIITEDTPNCWSIAALSTCLPAKRFHIKGSFKADVLTQLVLGWELGRYQFTKYKKDDAVFATLDMPNGADINYIQSTTAATFWARDMINTPANDMHPAALADEAVCWAKAHKAKITLLRGEELLDKNYPMIYTVGKASDIPPHLVDISFKKKGAPKVTLVGKGVTFDTGGLDIKSTAGMRMMKKDMGGAANVLALAKMIIDMKLPVQLRVLLPIVENAISGNAMRPTDIAPTRSGITVEIGNTDAEGRLILCDALTEADSEKPDIIIDCATLTGAARVALGTDIPVFFSNDAKLGRRLAEIAEKTHDPVWQLPLWQGYREKMNSPTAELSNDAQSGYGGAITAALFLQEFVSPDTTWLHVDMMGWNIKTLPGRPQGGEAMAVRTLYSLLHERYA